MSSPISTFLNLPTSPLRSRNTSPSRYNYGRHRRLQTPSPIKVLVIYASKFEESPVQKLNAVQRQLDYILRESEKFMSFAKLDVMHKLASNGDPFWGFLAELRLDGHRGQGIAAEDAGPELQSLAQKSFRR